MDDEILVLIEPGMRFQRICYYVNNKKYEEVHEMENLPSYLVTTCHQENCFKLHFIGSSVYIQGLAELVKSLESTKYNTQKIQIEVN